MIAVGYAAQAVEADGATTLILANGRAISVSAAVASALNAGRERNRLPTIPTLTQSDAQALRDELANQNARDEEVEPEDDCPQ